MQNKNSLLKITLALGLIVLFVGAGFTPDISGNIGKFSSSSNVKDKNMLRESLAIASEENII